jgi:ferredoxin
MKVILDPAKCMGHGRCYSLAPEVYASDDEGRGTLAAQDPPAARYGQARTGMLSCPERAITIED